MQHGGAIEPLFVVSLACREAAVGPAVGATDSKSVADGAMVGASDATTGEAVGEDDATTAADGADDGATDCKKRKPRRVEYVRGVGAPNKRE